MKSNISPLQARASGYFVNVIIIGAVIISLLVLFYIVYRTLTKKFNTPEWIEAQKKKAYNCKRFETGHKGFKSDK